MKLFRVPSKRTAILIAIFVMALVGEFFLLEGTTGIKFLSDRYSGLSQAELKIVGRDLHLVTRNTHFTVHEFVPPHQQYRDIVVLRQTVFLDRIDGKEGGKSRIKVEMLDDKKVRWSFEEDGIGPTIEGKIVADYVYEVSKFGCCGAPAVFSYYSLLDGRNLEPGSSRLSRDQVMALNTSLTK